MPHISTSRLRFHYRTHGNPDGLPMLLLHGSFASSRWWRYLLELMPDEIFAIAPDLRGAGATDKPAEGYAIADLAEDIHALVQALDLHDIDLVGHSSGGAVALEYALNHPERVATLSLIAPPSPEGVLTPLEGIMLLQQMRTDRNLLIKGLAAMMPTFAGVPPASDAEAGQFFMQLADDAAAQAPAVFTEIAVALGSWNRFVEAGQLALPTLLIWGDQDGIVEQDAMRRTLLAIPGAANLEVLRGVGHSPMLEAPLRLAERIINFITEDYGGFDQIRSQAYD